MPQFYECLVLCLNAQLEDLLENKHFVSLQQLTQMTCAIKILTINTTPKKAEVFVTPYHFHPSITFTGKA